MSVSRNCPDGKYPNGNQCRGAKFPWLTYISETMEARYMKCKFKAP